MKSIYSGIWHRTDITAFDQIYSLPSLEAQSLKMYIFHPKHATIIASEQSRRYITL